MNQLGKQIDAGMTCIQNQLEEGMAIDKDRMQRGLDEERKAVAFVLQTTGVTSLQQKKTKVSLSRAQKKKERLRAARKAKRKAKTTTTLAANSCICVVCTKSVPVSFNWWHDVLIQCRYCDDYNNKHAPVCCKRFKLDKPCPGVELTEEEQKLLITYFEEAKMTANMRGMHDPDANTVSKLPQPFVFPSFRRPFHCLKSEHGFI